MIWHLDRCKAIEHLDCADCTARYAGLVCNCAHNIARPNAIGAAHIQVQPCIGTPALLTIEPAATTLTTLTTITTATALEFALETIIAACAPIVASFELRLG